jgi:hypothetical protein
MAFISNGTTILDNGAFNVNLGSMVLLSEQTASSSANISFTSGIDSTYPIYKFEFINIHLASITQFKMNFSTDSGSNYNVTKTGTLFYSYHKEDDSSTIFEYNTSHDIAQGTGFMAIAVGDNDEENDYALSGELYLFNPSSTTFVKHFMSRINQVHYNDASADNFVAGYGNTTSAVDAIQFKAASGNIDSGTIKLYGIKDS